MIDGTLFLLTQGQDLCDLKARIEEAARAREFVEFSALGEGQVRVLVPPGAAVVLTKETVRCRRSVASD